MHRSHRRWYSGALGHEMDLLILGHAGARVLVFPTSMGRFFEWEDRGMQHALGEHLENGWIQLVCVDSIDAESWYNKSIHPALRAQRHTHYERYILDEVLPFSWDINPNPYLITTGASFGAYHAANLAFRHPRAVNRVIGLSGLYDVKQMTDGYSDDTVYFNNPSDYVQHESDADRLNALRQLDIILVTGRDDAGAHNNWRLGQSLSQRGIPHTLHFWDGWAHDWPYWQQMIQRYIGGAH